MIGENKYYVYRHYIGDNTFYVGKGSKDRAYVTRRSSKWHEFVNGREYEIEIVKYFDNNKEALKFEEELTQYYKNLGQCETNISIGAKRDDVTKRKISKAQSGENNSMFGVSRYGEENPFYGKTHSSETKAKIRNSLPDYSGENNPMFGKKHTEETIKKIRKNMPDLSGENSPTAKQITISINKIIHVAGCKKDMQKILLEKYGINAHNSFLRGNIPKKHRDIVDYIEVEGEIIYEKRK